MAENNITESKRFSLNRRRFVKYFSAIGLGATLLPGALTAVAQDASEITVEMVNAAAKIAGFTMTQEEMEKIIENY